VVHLRPTSRPRCPYCHDALGVGPPVRCLWCDTAYHWACAREERRCTVLGCRHLLPIDEVVTPWLQVALRLLACPFVLGARAALLLAAPPRALARALLFAGRRTSAVVHVAADATRAAGRGARDRLRAARARRALVRAVEAEWAARLGALEAEREEVLGVLGGPLASVALLALLPPRRDPPPALARATAARLRAERRLAAARAERDEEREALATGSLDEARARRAARLARWKADPA
jgi:hypothetical protein